MINGMNVAFADLDRSIGDDEEYPLDNGEPLSNDPEHLNWIFLCLINLQRRFRNDPQIAVVGDVLWYPVKGDTKVCKAPDIMIVFGRAASEFRAPYMQWEADGIPPAFVIEFVSKNNSDSELTSKLEFYDRYGVQEYYVYDYRTNHLTIWTRQNGTLLPCWERPFRSPLTGVEWCMTDTGLILRHPDGRPFEPAEMSADRADAEAERANAEADRADAEADRANAEAERAEAAEKRARQLAERLRSLGIDPEG